MVIGTDQDLIESQERLESYSASLSEVPGGDHGLPPVSFRDLMRHLATMTLNSVASPINKRYTFSLVSTPTALQTSATWRIGLIRSRSIQ